MPIRFLPEGNWLLKHGGPFRDDANSSFSDNLGGGVFFRRGYPVWNRSTGKGGGFSGGTYLGYAGRRAALFEGLERAVIDRGVKWDFVWVSSEGIEPSPSDPNSDTLPLC